MRATISLLGLYNYDNSILDGLTLPSNFTADELAALKSNLLMETAEFEILYSNFDFLKYAITQWCEKRKSTWEWLKKTQGYDYNPLENVDMHLEDHLGSKLEKDVITDFTRNLKSKESGSDILDRTDKQSGSDVLDRTDEQSGKDDLDRTDKKTGSDNTQHNVFAYDQNNTGSPESGDTTTYNSQIIVDQSLKYGKTVDVDQTLTYGKTVDVDQTLTYGKTVDDTGTTKNSVDHDEQLKKNYNKEWHGRDHISAQELIKQEQELAVFNILDFIIEDFKKRFCLLVY